MYLSGASNKFIRGRMDINNNVTVPQSRHGWRKSFATLLQDFMARASSGANLKALEFRIIFHAPTHRLLSSAHIDSYIHYSGAKSFVNNGRRESFLKSNET